MAFAEENAKHPLINYPESERIDYVSIVASIASADGKITDDELSRLRLSCEKFAIGDIGTGLILAAIEDLSIINIPAVLERLSHTELRFTLLSDMLFMAYADGIVCPQEEKEIQEIAAKLRIGNEQIVAISQYVESILAIEHDRKSRADWKNIGSEIAGVLAGAGVPIGTVVISGSFCGPGVTGMSSALEALGMEMGLTPGIGVVLSIGVCSYFGVRWLCEKL